MGFERIFDELFFSCELGCHKPDPAHFKIIEDRLGLNGERLLFWDDSAANVEAARKRGWNAVVYATLETFEGTLDRYLGEARDDAIIVE